jgi:hypothetical protein
MFFSTGVFEATPTAAVVTSPAAVSTTAPARYQDRNNPP